MENGEGGPDRINFFLRSKKFSSLLSSKIIEEKSD